MKINRIKWDKLKVQHQLRMMSAAYIHAEKLIMENPSLTGFQDEVEETIIYTTDENGEMISMTPTELKRQSVENEIKKLQEKRQQLIDDEKYELIVEVEELISIAVKRLAELR